MARLVKNCCRACVIAIWEVVARGVSASLTSSANSGAPLRKHAIKLLGAKTGWGGDRSVCKGRPPTHDDKVEEALWRIWKVPDQPCKRLKSLCKGGPHRAV